MFGSKCWFLMTWQRMHARVISETDARKGFLGADARNQKSHFDGCTQQTFGQRMRTRYGANPRCAQPTSQMHTTPLIWQRVTVVLYGRSPPSSVLRPLALFALYGSWSCSGCPHGILLNFALLMTHHALCMHICIFSHTYLYIFSSLLAPCRAWEAHPQRERCASVYLNLNVYIHIYIYIYIHTYLCIFFQHPSLCPSCKHIRYSSTHPMCTHTAGSILGTDTPNKIVTHRSTNGDSIACLQNNTPWHNWGLIQVQTHYIKLYDTAGALTLGIQLRRWWCRRRCCTARLALSVDHSWHHNWGSRVYSSYTCR